MSRRLRPPAAGRAAAAVVLATALVVGSACSGDDGAADDPDAVLDGDTDGTAPQVISDLLDEGEQVCDDEEGDVTQSARVDADPAVPQPGIDLLEGRATLDDDVLTATFTTVGPVRPEQDPEFVLFVGLVDDLNGFELSASSDPDGIWSASLLTRGEGVNEPAVLPTATVTVDGAQVELSVPRDQIPAIGPNQPVVYGSSGRVMDEGGTFLDVRGEPVEAPGEAARAFEECLSFGQ